MGTRSNKRRVGQLLFKRIYGHFIWPSSEDHAWDNIVPIGREFGSKDYERLTVLDAFTSGRTSEAEACGQLGIDRDALLAMQQEDRLR